MSDAAVIILGAGSGTRLRPYTDELPKCLVPFRGKPLLQHQLEVLRSGGIDDITVVAGYRKEALEHFAAVQKIGWVENPRYDQTNMVATLFSAESRFPIGKDLIISYGDIVFDRKVLDAVLAAGADICVPVDLDWRNLWSLRMEDPLADAETLKFDAAGRLLEIGKRPKHYEDIQAQYLGIVKIRADRIAAVRDAYHAMDPARIYDGKDFPNMYMTSFLQHLIDTGWHVQAVPIHGGWLEIDTVEDLRAYEELHRRNELARFIKL